MWSRNNNYRHQRYSIGKKIKYYENILMKSNNTNIKTKKYLERLCNLINGKKVFGNVFIVKDKEFNNNSNDYKPRQVVCVEAKNGKAVVLPIRKNKNMVNLSMLIVLNQFHLKEFMKRGVLKILTIVF